MASNDEIGPVQRYPPARGIIVVTEVIESCNCSEKPILKAETAMQACSLFVLGSIVSRFPSNHCVDEEH
jgi:hypothetical protein